MNQEDLQNSKNVETVETPKKRRRLHFPHSWADVKQLGWKMIAAFVLFYLIRDGILYVLLPYLAYKGIFE